METELAPVDREPLFVRPSCTAENNWYSHKLRTMWLGNANDPDAKENIVSHELSHFLLHAFTPYGAFLDELSMMQHHQVLSYCIEAVNYLYEKVRHPIYDFSRELLPATGRARSMVKNPESFETIIRRYIRPWSHASLLENILEGADKLNVRQATEGAALKTLSIVEGYSATNFTEDEELFLMGKPGNASIPERRLLPVAEMPEPYNLDPDGQLHKACMTIGWADMNRYSVGAEHIFESLAQLSEDMQGDVLGRIQPQSSHPYFMLWTLTMMEYGMDRITSRETFFQVLNTFRALCDLALFVPIGAIYGRLRRENMFWIDLHPGHRFLRALTVVPKIGWITDPEKEFVQFQEAICDELWWVKPKRFIELGAQLTHPNFVTHGDACRLRLKHPYPHLEETFETIISENFVYKHLPLLLFPGNDELIVSNEAENSALGRVLDYFLPQFCSDVMLKERLTYEDMLPGRIRFEGLFRNVKSVDDWLEIIFKAIPTMKPTNFQPLGLS
jgi:hypothetical protein